MEKVPRRQFALGFDYVGNPTKHTHARHEMNQNDYPVGLTPQLLIKSDQFSLKSASLRAGSRQTCTSGGSKSTHRPTPVDIKSTPSQPPIWFLAHMGPGPSPPGQ